MVHRIIVDFACSVHSIAWGFKSSLFSKERETGMFTVTYISFYLNLSSFFVPFLLSFPLISCPPVRIIISDIHDY